MILKSCVVVIFGRSLITLPAASTWVDITYGNGKFVIVADAFISSKEMISCSGFAIKGLLIIRLLPKITTTHDFKIMV
jgi:hypothetical protein